MDIFNATETISNTESSIAFLQELLEQQKKLLVLQQELEAALMVASQFDLLDHEYTRIQERVDLISGQILDLTPQAVRKNAQGQVKAKDLLPLLASNPNASLVTLISVHCGTEQWGSHCSVNKDGTELLIC
jgi:hypothetical protein